MAGGFEWWTVPVVCRALRLSRGTVLGLIYDGRLPAKKLTRGAWHVKASDVALWLTTPDNAPKQNRR